LNEKNSRITLGGTYDSNGYRMQCTQDSDGYLAIVFKSCIYNGVEHQPGEVWDDVKYAYTCVKQGDQLRLDVAGCIDQGRRVAIDEKVTKGSFVYQCLRTKNSTCSMCPVACTKEGREYAIGDTFERQDYWYSCIHDSDNGRKITIKPGGCVNEGRRLHDQDTFYKQDVIYQCYAREGEVKAMPVGCVQSGTDRKVGDTWIEGTAPYRYEMVCREQESDNSAVKMQKRCVYEVNQDQTHLQPGCYRVIGRAAFGCLKDTSDRLEIRAFQMDNIDQAGSLGLRYC